MKQTILTILTILITTAVLYSKSITDDTIWTASPNPFISSTNITIYNLTSDTTTLKIYDRWGNQVAYFFENLILTGTITVTFNADTLPDGGYVAFLKKNSQTYGKQLIKTINAGIPFIQSATELKFETYPNPVINILTVEFETPAISSPLMGGQGGASFILYDFTGKEISRIQKNHLPKGKHHEQFNTEQLSPGLYLFIANICTDTTPCLSQSFKILKM